RGRAVDEAIHRLDAEPAVPARSWLREPLAASPPDLDRAEARLEAADALQGTRVEPADGRALRSGLQNVLADPRFHPGDWQDFVPAWLLPVALLVQELLRRLWDLVRWPVDRLLDLIARTFSSPVVVLLWIAAALGIVALYRAGIRSALVRQAEIAVAAEPLPPTAAEALTAAQRQASLGRYREACHFVLLFTLLWIEERGEARFD